MPPLSNDLCEFIRLLNTKNFRIGVAQKRSVCCRHAPDRRHALPRLSNQNPGFMPQSADHATRIKIPSSFSDCF